MVGLRDGTTTLVLRFGDGAVEGRCCKQMGRCRSCAPSQRSALRARSGARQPWETAGSTCWIAFKVGDVRGAVRETAAATAYSADAATSFDGTGDFDPTALTAQRGGVLAQFNRITPTCLDTIAWFEAAMANPHHRPVIRRDGARSRRCGSTPCLPSVRMRFGRSRRAAAVPRPADRLHRCGQLIGRHAECLRQRCQALVAFCLHLLAGRAIRRIGAQRLQRALHLLRRDIPTQALGDGGVERRHIGPLPGCRGLARRGGLARLTRLMVLRPGRCRRSDRVGELLRRHAERLRRRCQPGEVSLTTGSAILRSDALQRRLDACLWNTERLRQSRGVLCLAAARFGVTLRG